MASYVVTKKIEIKRQEGDTGDIVFTVPSVIDMSTYTEVKFNVSAGHFTMQKTYTDADIAVSGQTITIALATTDTKGKESGQWELEISNDTEVITIGKGDFTIIKELIP